MFVFSAMPNPFLLNTISLNQLCPFVAVIIQKNCIVEQPFC